MGRINGEIFHSWKLIYLSLIMRRYQSKIFCQKYYNIVPNYYWTKYYKDVTGEKVIAPK